MSAFSKLGVVAIIAVAFTFGLVATVYLSLRSPKIQVPDVVNQQYMEGETTLEKSGLSIRERAKRYKPDVPPGVILDQSPRAGEVVKAGQTIAVVVSRARKEGEQPPSEEVAEERKKEETGATKNRNSDESKSENRERRKNKNANSNANLNGNKNANTGNRNQNGAAGRNANQGLNTNRNANRNTNDNAGRPRVTNNRNINAGGARNTNSARPASNANRRPNL